MDQIDDPVYVSVGIHNSYVSLQLNIWSGAAKVLETICAELWIADGK